LLRAAIYCRVSTEEQASEGMSISAQRKALLEYALRHQMVVVEEFIDEGVSARTDARPQFQRMIGAAKQKPRPFDVILIHKTDRFARNREDAIVYKSLLRRDCGIDVRSVTEQFEDSPTGKLLEGMMEVMAEFYSLNLSQEVMKGMKEKASQGKGLGLPPLGYRLGADGRYEIVPEEAAVVRFIFDTYVKEEGGLLAIAHRLHQEGFQLFGDAGRKYKWSSVGIRTILKNPAYIGNLVWNRRDGSKKHRPRDEKDWIVVEGAHEPIINRETFDAANGTLQRRQGVRNPAEDYMLRGLVRCGDCGGGMSYYRAQWRRKGGTKVIHPELACTRYFHTRACYFNHVSMIRIETVVLNYLSDVLAGRVEPDDIDITVAGLNEIHQEAEHLRKQLAQVDMKLQRQLQAYEAGAIGLSDLKVARERVEAERRHLRQQLDTIRAKLASMGDQHISQLRSHMHRVLTMASDYGLPPADRRRALQVVIDHVRYSRRNDRLDIVLRVSHL
jgi:site-specific DNA recombinase